MPKATLSRQLEAVAHPLTGALTDSKLLFALIGNARLCPAWRGLVRYARVEFYRARAQITKRLIHEKGFTTVEGGYGT